MLSPDKKNKSFRNVRLFAEAAGGTPDDFRETVDVLVQTSTSHLYRDIEIHISYRYGYRDYQIELMWENDMCQIDYHKLGLHGYYSTNFQAFSFSDNTLSFQDGDNVIVVFMHK